LRRALSRYLEDPLAEQLLRGDMQGKGVINISEKNGTLVFTPKAHAAKQVEASPPQWAAGLPTSHA